MSDATLAPQGFRITDTLSGGTRLVLIRHGEARCNEDGVVGGAKGCKGLTPRGQQQAVALRDRLRATGELSEASALYTSTLPRAIETASIIQPALTHLVATQREDLCEIHPGEADGLNWSEVVANFGEVDWDTTPDQPFAPGGESWTGFARRVTTALRELVALHPSEVIVLVVHGGVIEQALRDWRGDDESSRLRLRTVHCSMTELEYGPAHHRLLRYNDQAPVI